VPAFDRFVWALVGDGSFVDAPMGFSLSPRAMHVLVAVVLLSGVAIVQDGCVAGSAWAVSGVPAALNPVLTRRGLLQGRSRDFGGLQPFARVQHVAPSVRGAVQPKVEAEPASRRGALARLGAFATMGVAAVRRVAGHRLRFPAKKAASPVAEIAFAGMLFGTLREVVRNYWPAVDSFRLREELFQEMAVAQTYKNSVWPWVQTGVIAIIASIVVCVGIKAFIRSMKEWELQQERKEMSQMGEDALFLMSTPVDATPLEKKKSKMRKRLTPLPMRIIGKFADWLWVFRLGACVGYLLPLLNVLDFGEISISLNPYPLGVPASEPIVNFMQNTLKLKFLYQAYLKSGYYFLIVWFIFIQFFVRNKSAPFFLRFHSSQAILISMLLGVPQQVFFAVLNPWESGLVVQTIMYHSMVSIFLFTVMLITYCCLRALMKKTMTMPLVSEAAVMWAGKE